MYDRDFQKKMFEELSYFATKDNAKQILHVLERIICEFNLPDEKDDIHYGNHVNAVLTMFWDAAKNHSGNKPQQKRMMRIFHELENVICDVKKEDDLNG